MAAMAIRIMAMDMAAVVTMILTLILIAPTDRIGRTVPTVARIVLALNL